MAEINLGNESTISTNISTDTPITTNVPDINYIPGYKAAEEERRANEVIRQENEQDRVALYEDMENKLETGYFNGRDGVIQYTAGTGIDITDNVISSTHTSAVWGNIGGDLADQTDLASALNDKADSSSIPTKTSDLQNDSNFVESSSLSTVATSGSYTDLTDKPTIPDELKDLTDDSTHRLVTDTEKTAWSEKQDALVSGTNIKTINNTSLLGSGNITVSADDEIAISTTQPTGNETLWINPNEAPSGSLNPISNTYGVAQDKGYSQEYANKNLIYSTSEQDTGKKWIDGKPIYRKVYITNKSDTSSSTINVTNDITNFGALIDIKGVIYRTGDTYNNIPNANPNADWLVYYSDTDSSYFRIRMGSSMYGAMDKIHTIVEYTKTTD